jgi:hypothetical protein
MSTDDQDATLYRFTPPPPAPPGDGGLSSPGSPDGPDGPGEPSEARARTDNRGTASPSRRRSRVTKAAAGLALVLGTGTGAAVVLTPSPGRATSLASTNSSARASSPSAGLPAERAARAFWHELFGPLGGPAGPVGAGGPAGPTGPVGEVGTAEPAGVPGRGFGPPLGLVAPGGVVHGSFTVRGPNGTFETLDTQVGTVQTVSPSSITVKSADGYSQDYSVSSSTVVFADYNGIGSVNKGDDVAVVGLVGSSGITAKRVVDITQVQANGRAWEPAPPNHFTTPSTTSSGATTGNFTDDPEPAA